MKVLDAEQIKSLRRENFKKTKQTLKTVDGERVRSQVREEKKPIPKSAPAPIPKPIDYSLNLNGIGVMVSAAIQSNSSTLDATNKAINGIPGAINKAIESFPKPVRKWTITVSERDQRGHIKAVELSAE